MRQAITLGDAAVRGSGHVLRVSGDRAECAGKLKRTTKLSELSLESAAFSFCLAPLTKPKRLSTSLRHGGFLLESLSCARYIKTYNI